jgi:hypothetical protein
MTTFTELVLQRLAAALAAKFNLDEVDVYPLVLAEFMKSPSDPLSARLSAAARAVDEADRQTDLLHADTMAEASDPLSESSER